MPKSPKDDIDFFRRANISAVQRVLKRARENELKHKRRPKLTMTIKNGLLDKALDLALRHNGRTAKNQPSIRYTAPSTGGRPFHFGYTTVNKNDPKNRAKSKAADGAKQAAASGKPAGKSRAAQKVAHRSLEAAHQHYTERDSAVERDKQEVDPELLDKLKGMDRATDAAEQNQGQGEEAGPEQSGGYDAHGRLRDAGSEKQEPDNLLDHEQETNPERPKNGIERNRDDNIDPDQEQPSSAQAKDKTRDGADARQDINNSTPGDEPSEPSSERKATRDAAGPPMTALEFVEESSRNIPGIAETSSEAAAQRYIESPEKVAKIMGTTSSFGTIGRTLEERMDFWDLVNEHEREVDARTQSRLVVELPHEANAKHRHEIVRRYVSEFERKGIPYWASIHEPTEDNDSRNYHAHIVFTDRPMKLMQHPECQTARKRDPRSASKKDPSIMADRLVQVANRRDPRARVARFKGAGVAGAWEVPVCPPGRSWPRFRLRSRWNASGGKPGVGSGEGVFELGAVSEAPAFIAGFDDVAMMGQPVEQRRRHFGIAEHTRPFAKG